MLPNVITKPHYHTNQSGAPRTARNRESSKPQCLLHQPASIVNGPRRASLTKKSNPDPHTRDSINTPFTAISVILVQVLIQQIESTSSHAVNRPRTCDFHLLSRSFPFRPSLPIPQNRGDDNGSRSLEDRPAVTKYCCCKYIRHQ